MTINDTNACSLLAIWLVSNARKQPDYNVTVTVDTLKYRVLIILDHLVWPLDTNYVLQSLKSSKLNDKTGQSSVPSKQAT